MHQKHKTKTMRITRDNLPLLANRAAVSTNNLYDKMLDAQLTFIEEQDKQWAYEFFGKDAHWYDETMQKVREIRDSLPKNMNPIEATIKQYGWITKNGKKELSMPMIYDRAYPEFAHAITIEYILTNLNSYHRAMNWD